MDTPDLNRLTILERAQQLHDATLRRHGEMLDRHETSRLRHEVQLTHLREVAEQQNRFLGELQALNTRLLNRQDQHADWLRQHGELLREHTAAEQRHAEEMRELRQILQAIKELLDRRNGP